MKAEPLTDFTGRWARARGSTLFVIEIRQRAGIEVDVHATIDARYAPRAVMLEVICLALQSALENCTRDLHREREKT